MSADLSCLRLGEDVRVDVMDRQEGCWPSCHRETYYESADQILDSVVAELEVWVCVGKLREGQSCLLVANGAAGEVGLAEYARAFRGVIELDAFVEALNLELLDAGSALSVSLVRA